MGYLISETTKEEREQIVKESLGNIEANCDGCMAGLAEMYQDYIDGKREIRDINMEFNARYVKGDDMPEKGGCAYM
ncbi:MAG: purine biosynthesis protein PurH [Lachnospiraceae bacterium]|nr:purine biosynthesis protein PurH [Lachnospiraceae bacterium]